ncbi:hypothetical protein E3O25_00655 [Cryobacterium sp. TMT1-3]|nr:hypothetical protein E3O25_00655 [Cryobacterium sp. TMT1-3]
MFGLSHSKARPTVRFCERRQPLRRFRICLLPKWPGGWKEGPQRVSASAHQRISASAHQRISASAHQRISASAHQSCRNPLRPAYRSPADCCRSDSSASTFAAVSALNRSLAR